MQRVSNTPALEQSKGGNEHEAKADPSHGFPEYFQQTPNNCFKLLL
jgi:hypothetical protein